MLSHLNKGLVKINFLLIGLDLGELLYQHWYKEVASQKMAKRLFSWRHLVMYYFLKMKQNL